MGWIVRFELAATNPDAASSLLWDLNTTGIAEIDPAPGADAIELIAGFETEAEAQAAAGALLAPHPASPIAVAAAVERIDPTAWVDPTRSGSINLGGRAHSFEVGPAFGHGGHPTTALALSLLDAVIEPADSLLDFGTGTGVLALAGRSAGASPIVAVDIDPAARAVAEANLTAGSGPVGPVVTDQLPSPSAHPGGFDVIAANVLLSVHVEHGPALVDLLSPRGSLIATGVLAEQEPHAMAAYERLTPRRRLLHGDWVALLLGPATTASS